MKQIFAILFGIIFSTAATAQLSLQYTNTRQAPASHNMTILDQIADDNSNLYIVYSDDPSKILLLSKIDIAGTTLWTDTIAVPAFPQVDVTKAKLNFGQNKVYVLFPGYSNPSPAGAIVAIFDLNGTYLNGFNASNLNNVWSYGVHGIHEKLNGNILVYYSYGDQFTANDTMYVKEFTPNFMNVWTVKYPVAKLTWHCPNLLESNGDFYFSYTNDSVAGGIHYLKSYTRKVDNTGNVLWTNVINDVANRWIRKMFNADIAIAGNNNPNGSLMGNNTGDVKISKIDDANGSTSWTQTYNGPGNEREEVYGLCVNQLNDIFIVGTEDIHDYAPYINKGFLRKYNSTGQLQYSKNVGAISSSIGVFLSALGDIHTFNIVGNGVHIKKIQASTGNTIDSLNSNITYPMGMTGICNNSNDDLFFTYSEGHCGANHLQALRFCTKALCNPDGIRDLVEHAAPLLLYPNPASTTLHIEMANGLAISQLNIYSISGTKMDFQYDNGQIDISKLATGMYILSYQINDKKQIIKFFKE